AAGGPPTSAKVEFRAFFRLGAHEVNASVSDTNGCVATCSSAVRVLTNSAPTVSCPGPMTLNCASPTGGVATISVDVADADGDPLVVVWTVDGTARQTNVVAATKPPTSTNVNFTALFGL